MLDQIIEAIVQNDGTPLFVGGFVRDAVLEIPSKDVDVEVFGLSLSELAEVLGDFGVVDFVGQSFGVLRVHGLDVDFSIPRRESKAGIGHRGFEIDLATDLSVKEAAQRRDFTINTLSMNPFTGEILDPFDGIADILSGTLRAVGPQFGEDPLRVLRGFQFAGRFDLTATPETLDTMRSLINEAQALPLERVWGEWFKWASKSIVPSRGLELLDACGWVALWPEIADLRNTLQQPEHHPEGTVWEHTLFAVDAAAEIATSLDLDPVTRALVVFAALLHDVGKVVATHWDEVGNIVSQGHAEAGDPLVRSFLDRIKCPAEFGSKIIRLVVEHMAHVGATVTPRMVRRLAARLHPASIAEWAIVVEADHSARPPLPGGLPENARQVVEVAHGLHVQSTRPDPIVMGRHIIHMVEPGPEMGQVLRAAFEAQLDGEFETREAGVDWVTQFIGTP